MKYWRRFQAIFDLQSGTALGLLTLAVVYSIFRGHDIGAGSAAAYATAIGAFAATKIKGKVQPEKPVVRIAAPSFDPLVAVKRRVLEAGVTSVAAVKMIRDLTGKSLNEALGLARAWGVCQ